MKLLSPEVEVTRLLYSNLIKSGIVSVDGKEKRIIDSDSIFSAGFRPLVFEQLDGVEGALGEQPAEEAAFDEGITMESGLTQEQTDLLFHTDSDEAAVQMLMGDAKEPAVVNAGSGLLEQQALKEAKVQAEQMIEDANAQADAILADAQAEAQRMAEQAHQDGFSQGYEEGMSRAADEIESQKQQLSLQAQQLQEDYAQQVTELEPQVVMLISDIVKKLTGVVLAERKDILTHLVSSCLEGIERSGQYLIHVSKVDYHDMAERKEELEALVESASEVRIVEDASLSKNQCLIETDTAIYDSSLDLQLERLCEDLKMLSLQS